MFGSAKGVVIEYCTNQNATTDRYDRPVVSFQTSGTRLLSHVGPVSDPNRSLFYGGIGSVIRSTTGSTWIKKSGGSGPSGWVREN